METYSLRSLDVGFDLRALKMTATLPAGTTAVLCDMPRRKGPTKPRKEPVTGSPTEILRTLRRLGYSVRWGLPGGSNDR